MECTLPQAHTGTPRRTASGTTSTRAAKPRAWMSSSVSCGLPTEQWIRSAARLHNKPWHALFSALLCTWYLGHEHTNQKVRLPPALALTVHTHAKHHAGVYSTRPVRQVMAWTFRDGLWHISGENQKDRPKFTSHTRVRLCNCLVIVMMLVSSI